MQLGEWTMVLDSSDTYALGHEASGIRLSGVAPLLVADGQSVTGWTCRETDDHFEFELDGAWRIDIKPMACGAPWWLALEVTLTNLGGASVAVDRVGPFADCKVTSPEPLDRVLVNGRDMCSFSALHDATGERESSVVIGLTNAQGRAALVAGYVNLGEAFATATSKDGNTLSLAAEREGIALGAGASLAVGTFVVGGGESLSALMDGYAHAVAQCMGHRETPPPMGWCSWYYYYNTTTEEDLWENVKAIKASPYREHMRVIQLDDGWNLPDRDAARVWGDWHAGALFPGGMKKLANDLKQEGFVPGLWLAPFSVDKASRLAEEHADWLIEGDDGPLDQWGVYGLDLTHPGARDFLRETFTRVFDEWGFDYVKIDFLMHALGRGRRYDNSVTTAEAYRMGLRIVREVAKDRFVLCCGAPMGPSVGLCDGMRIGFDVSSRWSVPINAESWPLGNLNIIAPATHTVWRQWMHGRWWQNDPDCIVTRDYGSAAERAQFENHFPVFATSPPYGLTDEEAECWSQLVWFTGGMALVSENMAELRGSRYELLAHSFPPNAQGARWVDWYGDPSLAVLRSDGDTPMLGVFNLGDAPVTLTLPREKLGLEDTWSLRERLSGDRLTGTGDDVSFPELPPHAGRVWIVQ